MLATLALLTAPSQADTVTIEGPTAGQFGATVITGSAWTADTHVRLNGVQFRLDPDIYPFGPKKFAVDVRDLPPSLFHQHQSAMHSVRAEITSPTSQTLASDHVAWYDTSEIGSGDTPGTPRPDASSLRITKDGLDTMAEIAEAMLAQDLEPLTLLGAEARAVDVVACRQVHTDPETGVETRICLEEASGDIGAGTCQSMASLGLQIGDFGDAPLQFGVGVDIFALEPSVFTVCLEGYDLAYTRDFEDILDGVDPLLAFTPEPGRLRTSVELGPAALRGDLTLHASLEVDPLALAGFPAPIGGTVEVIQVPIPCAATVSIAGARTHVGVELHPDGAAIDARQILDATQVHLHDLDLQFGGICSLIPLPGLLEGPLEPVFKAMVADMFNVPLKLAGEPGAEPVVAALLQSLLREVPMQEGFQLGEAELTADATMIAVDEDNHGISFVQDTRITATAFDPEVGLVPGQPFFYAPAEFPPLFTTSGYDMEATVSTALLSQMLYEAFRAGFFHDRMTLRTDLSDLGFDTQGLADEILTPEFLANLFQGVDLLIPDGLALEIHAGPTLAPVIVAEDPSSSLSRDLHASMLGYELRLVEAGTDTVWATVVADFKMRLRLEVTPDGSVQPILEDQEFTMDYIDPDGTLNTLIGPYASLAYPLEANVENHIREMLLTPLEALPLRSVTLDDTLGMPQQLVFTAQQADTQHQRETLRMGMTLQ